MTSPALTADQCRIGRAALGFTEQQLAAAAGVAASAVVALEAGTPVDGATETRIAAALATAGVTFYVTPSGSLRMRARTLDGIIESPVTMAPR